VRELARPSVGSGDVTSVWTERVLARRVDDSPWHPECLAHPGLPLAPNWLRTDLRLGVWPWRGSPRRWRLWRSLRLVWLVWWFP